VAARGSVPSDGRRVYRDDRVQHILDTGNATASGVMPYGWVGWRLIQTGVPLGTDLFVERYGVC